MRPSPRQATSPHRNGAARRSAYLSLSLYLGIAIGPPIAEWIFASGSYLAVWLTAAVVAGIAVAQSVFVLGIGAERDGQRSRCHQPVEC